MSRRLSPIDIQHAEFSRSVGGYDRKEVRAFLERLSVEVEAGLREAQTLRQKLDQAEVRMEELKAAEAELQRAVMAAERIATDMKEVARREAELLLQDAERQKASRLRSAEEALQRMQSEVSRLEHQRALFREQFRGLLQAYLTGLDAVGEPPAHAASQRSADQPAETPESAAGALLDDLLDDTVQP